MKKITLKFSIKKFIRENLVIFWNLLLVFADDDFDTLNEPMIFSDAASNEYMSQMGLQSNNLEFILEKDKTKFFELMANQTKKFLYLTQIEAPPFSITVIPCGSDIRWTLFFRDQNGTGQAIISNYTGALITTYQGSDTKSYVIELTDLGLYTVEVTALNENTTVMMSLSEDHEGLKLLKLKDNDEEPRHITVKFKFKTNSTLVKWPKIFPKADFTNAFFMVVVSKKNYCKSLCTTISREPSTIKNVLHRNKYEITNMTYEEQYFINVFVMDNAFFSIPYAQINFVYRKRKPVALRDGKLMRGDLKYNAGILSYRYKVTNITLSDPNNKLVWFVIPCGGKVEVEIRHRKKIILNGTVLRYKNFTIENPVQGDRYVMKIKSSRVEFVEVLATMRPKLNPLPNFSENLSVKEFSKENGCHSKYISTTIRWLSVISEEPIIYCVNVIELNYNELTKQNISNLCHLSLINSIAKKTPKCFEKSSAVSGKYQTQGLHNLKRDRDYIVQVTARKYNKRASISYNLIRIRRNNSCSINENV